MFGQKCMTIKILFITVIHSGWQFALKPKVVFFYFNCKLPTEVSIHFLQHNL